MKTYPSRLGGLRTCSFIFLHLDCVNAIYAGSRPDQPSRPTGERLISSDYLPVPYRCSWIEHSRPLGSLFSLLMYQILIQFLHAANLIIPFLRYSSCYVSPFENAPRNPKNMQKISKSYRKNISLLF